MAKGQFSQFEDHLTSIAALAHIEAQHVYGVDNVLWETMGYFADRPFAGIPSREGIGPLQFEDAERYLKWREITLRKARLLRAGRPIGTISLQCFLQEAA